MKNNKLILVIFLSSVLNSVFGQPTNKSIKDTCIKTSNTLSLNGDSRLHLFKSCDLSDFNFKLYDRWGVLLYETSEFAEILDLDIQQKTKVGKKEKNKYPNGVYVWLASYTIDTNGGPSSRNSTGHLTIISNP